ncbi:MAG: DinB family protein [Sphingobacteriales bacterium]|nr:MAG: DinB family protein [Sphingobacteriales bacterium]
MITKPQPVEYAQPLPGNYIQLIGDKDILTVLEAQRDNCYNLLKDLSDEKANYAYAEGKWTVKESLGHMIDTERTFSYRAFAFSRGQAELPGFDQNAYVSNSNFNALAIKDLAEEFKLLRNANLHMFRSLTTQQLDRTGIASGNKITVRALVYATAGHERHHLNLFRERYKLSL